MSLRMAVTSSLSEAPSRIISVRLAPEAPYRQVRNRPRASSLSRLQVAQNLRLWPSMTPTRPCEPLPGKLVDTDDWIHTDYALWHRYTSGSHVLGVPCIFYAERFMADWHGETPTLPIPIADLEAIGDAWRAALGERATP